MTAEMYTLRNCESVPRDAIPKLAMNEFYAALGESLCSGGRMASYFAFSSGHTVRLIAVIARQSNGTLSVCSCDASPEMPSLAAMFPQVQLFEREIAEQFGIAFTSHPWFKPVRFHGPLTDAKNLFDREIGDADFFAMAGEEVHEVAVGPVHAGVIEPGHFRFVCHGEEVFHLEISLGYQHRGIEKSLIGAPATNTRFIMETCAGDTTIGHTLAYCHLVEALSSAAVPPRAHALRAVALELERCANHIGDIGALSGDVAFLPTAAYCGRIRGDVLNLSAALCGSRFGRSFLREGGVQFDLEDARRDRMLAAISSVKKDFTNAADLMLNEPSVLARFEETGTITKESCERWGLVGPAARACGCMQDVRQDFPSGLYQFVHVPVITYEQGDVFARAIVRYGEVLQSLDFIAAQCRELPSGAMATALDAIAPDRFTVSLVEGWRGEICHAAMTDAKGKFIRYKIVDPSFHNWTGLALSLRNQQISDFPLCNKSFNLSYCGYDL
jgi:Ni,Fe-hydrogenase III large subunit